MDMGRGRAGEGHEIAVDMSGEAFVVDVGVVLLSPFAVGLNWMDCQLYCWSNWETEARGHSIYIHRETDTAGTPILIHSISFFIGR